MAGKRTSAKRTRLTGDDRRQAIMDAAHALFIAKGFNAVSIDEIVSTAGGSKSAIYQFFGNKEGLLAAVTEHLARQMLSEMALPESKGMSVRDSLNHIGLELIRLILSHNAISQYQLAIRNLTVNPELSHLWYHRGPQTTFDGFAAHLRKEVRAGRLKIKDCRLAADAFLGMLMSRHNLAMSVGLPAPSPREMKQIVAHTVDVFLAAHGT